MELLAIIIRFGSKTQNVIEVSSAVLRKFHTLKLIEKITINNLTKIDGIGQVKALEIKSLFEFARRFNQEVPLKIQNANDAVKYVFNFINNWNQEAFFVLVTDRQKNIIACDKIYNSHINGISIPPREIIAYVLKSGGFHFCCLHNHPSGNPTPSLEDILATERLIYLSSIMNIKLFGHVIFTETGDFKIV